MWSLLFSEICCGCDGAAPRGLCATCAAQLPRVRRPCSRCGLAQPVAVCPRRGGGWRVERVIAPLAYAAPLDRYVQSLKYRGSRHLGRTLGFALADAAQAAARDVDALVAVPLHPARWRERGYNQAVEIARTVAAELGVALELGGTRRQRAASSQTAQTASARRASVAGSFVADGRWRGRKVAIVDDVLTTGATVNALAAVLLAAGAVRCEAWAVARTPERRADAAQ